MAFLFLFQLKKDVVTILIYIVILGLFCQYYYGYFVEDTNDIVVNSIFGKKQISFDDIKEVNYFSRSKGG